jgi:hypothetical protein
MPQQIAKAFKQYKSHKIDFWELFDILFMETGKEEDTIVLLCDGLGKSRKAILDLYQDGDSFE